VRIGGTGLGPGGGSGGDGTTTGAPGAAAFFGVPELTPLIGGSGGGGGGSNGSAINCAGGGGGGGGGALLIVANGTLTINSFYVYAYGGAGGSAGNTTCSNTGSGGSGGAIRLVANHFANIGTNFSINAYGGSGFVTGAPGRIRLESIDTSALTVAYSANPTALRVVGPGPVANAISPTVRISAVGGQPTPAAPQGVYGAIDIVLPAPGNTAVVFLTSGVPSGTTVLVTVKPRIGGAAVSQTVPLNTCDDQLVCAATSTFNLGAGAYTVEARATFIVQ
jgi:hypothetical protein